MARSFRIVATLAALAALAAAGCRKKDGAGGEPGPAIVIEAGGSPASAQSANAEDGETPDERERQCYVALKRPWGTAIRSFRGLGSRDEILRQAQLKACGEIGVVEGTCTDDLFDMDLAGCVGDARAPRPRDDQMNKAAASIREAMSGHEESLDIPADDPGAAPGPAGTPPGTVGEPPPPEPEDAGTLPPSLEVDGRQIPL